jgi:hypothetical protein
MFAEGSEFPPGDLLGKSRRVIHSGELANAWTRRDPMRDRTSFSKRQRVRRKSTAASALLAATVVAVAAPAARATVGLSNVNDPAGDSTAIPFRFEGSTALGGPVGPFQFQLLDNDFKSFGQPPGTYVAQALPPAGWKVGDIQCVDRDQRPGAFAIDVPNGRVTITHATNTDEQWCTFTSRRASAASSPGVSPSPPPSLIPPGSLPQTNALVRVTTGRRFATVTVRVPQRSVIRADLLRRTHVVGSKRVAHRAGTWRVKVPLRSTRVAQFRRQGLKRVTLTLRVVVVPDGGARQTFRHGVIIRL